MIVKSQKEKEKAICSQVEKYLAQGSNKSEAVRKVMAEFNYLAEASIYNILRRNKKE